jgi:hypothetical protein
VTHTNRGRLSVDLGGAWRIYWTGPVPHGLQALGTVTRNAGDTGALFEGLPGNYWQGNVRDLARVDADKVRAAIARSTPRRGGAKPNGGRPTADGVRGMVRRNVTLDDASVDALRKLGDGDLSLGIRRAAARL